MLVLLLYKYTLLLVYSFFIIVTDVFCVLQYDNIDAEHKAIFECIFNCAKDPANAGLLTKLYDVTDDHFKDEEVRFIKIHHN